MYDRSEPLARRREGDAWRTRQAVDVRTRTRELLPGSNIADTGDLFPHETAVGVMLFQRPRVQARHISRVHLLVDWHNVQSRLVEDFDSNPKRNLPLAFFKLQEVVGKILNGLNGVQKYRVTTRIYHGWHQEREPTVLRRLFEAHEHDLALGRRIGAVSYAPGFQFGNELACRPKRGSLFNTHRGGGLGAGQKMVDTAIVCDALHVLGFDEAELCLVVSDDDDMVPAVVTAEAWSRRAIVLRPSGRDLSGVTAGDCTNLFTKWMEE